MPTEGTNRSAPRAAAILLGGFVAAATALHGADTTGSNRGAETAAAPATPFLRFRDATLDYHGSTSDPTHLAELRIGWFGPTNLADPLHGDVWWVAQRVVAEANAQRTSVSDLPIRLLPCWSDNPWGSGVSDLARMIYRDQPLAILGSIDSAATHLAEQVVAKAQLPLLSPLTSDPSVTLAGVPWMFAVAPSDTAIARTLVDAVLEGLADAKEQRGVLVLVSGTDHESRMTTRAVMREFTRRGRLPDFRFEAAPGAGDLTTPLRGLGGVEPDRAVVIAGAEDAARWVQAVRAAFPRAALFGGHTLGRARFRELAGPAADGVRCPQPASPDPKDAQWLDFARAFREARGREPDYAAVLARDATRLLIEAIRCAGPHRDGVRTALRELSPWSGLGGQVHFDGTGQNTRTDLGLEILGTARVAASPSR